MGITGSGVRTQTLVEEKEGRRRERNKKGNRENEEEGRLVEYLDKENGEKAKGKRNINRKWKWGTKNVDGIRRTGECMKKWEQKREEKKR